MPKSELDKVVEHRHDSQVIGAFLDWMLNDRNYRLAKWTDDDQELEIQYKSIEQIIAEYYEIDLKQLDAERLELLKRLRTDPIVPTVRERCPSCGLPTSPMPEDAKKEEQLCNRCYDIDEKESNSGKSQDRS